MESSAEYLERCRAAFKIKSDAHIAREIGVSPQGLHKFKHGEKQLGKEVMIRLAERSGLDVNEALVLRALWASNIETIPNYASYLRKFAGCFLAFFALVLSGNHKLEKVYISTDYAAQSVERINIMRLSWKLCVNLLRVLPAFCMFGPCGLLQLQNNGARRQFYSRLRVSFATPSRIS